MFVAAFTTIITTGLPVDLVTGLPVDLVTGLPVVPVTRQPVFLIVPVTTVSSVSRHFSYNLTENVLLDGYQWISLQGNQWFLLQDNQFFYWLQGRR